MRYRRSNIPGGTYFFTVNLFDRNQKLLIDHIDLLRSSEANVKAHHPFTIDAMVVLPDHCMLSGLYRKTIVIMLPDGC